jgi:GAF domain-containing protein
MTPPDRSDLSHDQDLHLIEVLRLLQHLVLPPKSGSGEGASRQDLLAELAEDMNAFCQALELKRAVVYEALYDDFFDGLRLSLLASSAGSEKKTNEEAALERAGLPIAAKSELFTLLNEGQCIPLGYFTPGAAASAASPQSLRELAEFLGLRGSASAVIFPLASTKSNRVRGIVLMERDSSAGGFSENLLDLGAVISQMLESKLLQLGAGSREEGAHAEEAFERRVLPVVVINRKSLMIERLNDAAILFLGRGEGALGEPLLGRKLSMVFPGASHFIEVLEKACAKNSGPSCFSLAAKDLSHTGCAFALISFVGEGGHHVWVQLIPEDFLADSGVSGADVTMAPGRAGEGAKAGAHSQDSSGKGTAGGAARRGQALAEDESAAELSRRLSFERWLRQTICKLHSSLDRDHVLQTLADSLGRAFRTTRCLVIRTDGPSHPMVTHEYVEPDLSPLGLGRTEQFPSFAISLFVQKTVSYGDVAKMKSTGPLIPDEVEQLLENGILSMAGAPLSYQGQPFGVLILVDGTRPRKWTEEELETIELTASQAAVSLSHSQTYHQAKDQLFHMNLLGNLTQQLTNALEVATKAPTKAAPAAPDKGQADGGVTPLSSRELEVLRLIASGFANREIAQRLFLTESTVELHASRIRKKLHLKSRTALVKYACDYGLV